MTVRRLTVFGGERYLKNRHKKDPRIRIALKQVSDARKTLSDAVQRKNDLIKNPMKNGKNWKSNLACLIEKRQHHVNLAKLIQQRRKLMNLYKI